MDRRVIGSTHDCAVAKLYIIHVFACRATPDKLFVCMFLYNEGQHEGPPHIKALICTSSVGGCLTHDCLASYRTTCMIAQAAVRRDPELPTDVCLFPTALGIV